MASPLPILSGSKTTLAITLSTALLLQSSAARAQTPQPPITAPVERPASAATQPPAAPVHPSSSSDPTVHTPPQGTTLTSPQPTGGDRTPAPQRALTVSPDAMTPVTLSASGINRLIFPSPIASAHTNSEAIDADLRGNTAIVTFRTPDPADILFFTASGQYLLRITPKDLPPQTVKLAPRTDTPAPASSYQSQLAGLIEAGYRREPPTGYRVERPGTPLTIDGALQWWVAIRYTGRTFSMEEYVVYNAGAIARTLMESNDIARRFSPHTRAVSADPPALQPGQWGRVIAVFPAEAAVETSHVAAGGR